MGIPFHPLAEIFPLIEGAEFEAMCRDISENGLHNPILIWRGAIIDGRNRYRALCCAGWSPEDVPAPVFDLVNRGLARDVSGVATEELPAYVVSLNLHRRHLDETQRALIAAKLVTRGHGGARRGDVAESSANLRHETGIADAAALLNVSPRQVDSARALMREAPPAVLAEAERGLVSLHAAQGGLRAAREAIKREGGPFSEEAIQHAYDRLKAETEASRIAAKARKKAERAVREQRLAGKIAEANAALAGETKRYGVILADPEWRFETWGEGGMDRAPENHYPTSPTEEIMARPVGTLAARDCVLFLWATAPMLPDALEVMAAWGFKYKSQCIWRKAVPITYGEEYSAFDLALCSPVLGTGYWFRNAHEILLVGTRGDVPAPAMGDQFPSIIDAPPGRHSEKPEAFHALIEAYFPSLPKIELNARATRPGWDCWGAEAPEAVG